MTGILSGKTAIITGASQGLGKEIARAYLNAGASLFICARDEALLEKTCLELKAFANQDSQRIYAAAGDISRQEDVDRLVHKAFQVFPRIEILVNNAGIYGPKGPIEEVDWSEWVRAVEINLLGSVLMCRAILRHFKKNHYGKIIQLSGGGATNPLPHISAYAASKAAIVRFSETLAEEVREFGIDVNAIAPGALNTRLLDEVISAGPEKVGDAFYQRSLKQKQEGGVSLEKGAELAVFLGSPASDGISGKLISAIWDDWKAFPQHADEINHTDIYTLRRIVPKDRNQHWGNSQ